FSLVRALLLPPPPRSILFPYTTLFRSATVHGIVGAHLVEHRVGAVVRPVAGQRGVGPVDGDHKIRLGLVEILYVPLGEGAQEREDRKSTRLNSSHVKISYAVFCLKKKT